MDFQQFCLMQITELDLIQQVLSQRQMEEHFQAGRQLHAQALNFLDGIHLQMVQVHHMHWVPQLRLARIQLCMRSGHELLIHPVRQMSVKVEFNQRPLHQQKQVMDVLQ